MSNVLRDADTQRFTNILQHGFVHGFLDHDRSICVTPNFWRVVPLLRAMLSEDATLDKFVKETLAEDGQAKRRMAFTLAFVAALRPPKAPFADVARRIEELAQPLVHVCPITFGTVLGIIGLHLYERHYDPVCAEVA